MFSQTDKQIDLSVGGWQANSTGVWDYEKRYSVEELDNTPSLSSYTGAEETWRLISSWYNNSTQSAAWREYRRRHEYRRLPKRLIDIGSADQSNRPRLVELQHEQGNLEYITLSHRWPSPLEEEQRPILKLSTASKTNMCRQIPVSELSPVFRDSIALTRRLKVRYLWIDALCIIQDDPDDQKSEIERMADIYKGSVCNIAAAEDYQSNAGLYRHRDTSRIGLPKVDIKWDLHLRPRLSDDLDHDGPFYIMISDWRKTNILRAPVNQRAVSHSFATLSHCQSCLLSRGNNLGS